MIIIQIILGGITRLTDSGLSITEWQPILGTLPPTSEAQWQEAFDKYKKIAQYDQLHSYFTLENFKSIYFWEWLHRLWGRLIGVVFIIPFIFFLVKKQITRDMVIPLIVLFLLGLLQAVIGWFMVLSGLNDEDLYVSHIRLAIHFMAAVGLLAYLFQFYLKVKFGAMPKIVNGSSRNWLWSILIVLVVQLIYGALMAGLKAGMFAPTWPNINGRFLPADITTYGQQQYGIGSALFNHPLLIQFIHRMLAYILTVLIVAWSFGKNNYSLGGFPAWLKWAPLFFVVVQVALGVLTVTTSTEKVPQQWGVFEWYAQLHQVTALLLLLSLMANLFLHAGKRSAAM